MQDYPHHYVVSADAPEKGVISVSSEGLETLPSLAPAEFGGPGDLWSPETFLVASRVTLFTEYHIRVTLHVPAGTDEHKAERLVEKSESVCLVTNSLTGEKHLTTQIVVDP
jgi:organic hydroperoxide reductase OsmC/OhrA